MIPFYEWFYNVLLTSANSVPIQSLWVAFFANPVDLNRAIQAGLYENGYGYYTLAAGAAVNTAQGAVGAIFANSITIPGDGMNVSKIGPDGSGLIKGNISSGRQDMENLTISFLDTNMSFTDYNLRPWTIYASHKSLKNSSVKTTIIILQLAKAGVGKMLIPRAIWTFHDACPVKISSQEWNYGGDNVVSRQVEFAYNYYILNADPGITALKTVASVLDATKSNHTHQPVEIEKGGLEVHDGSYNLIKTSRNDITKSNAHSKGQQIITPTDDMINRSIDIGLEILGGNSNVTIASDDAIRRLRIQAEEIKKELKIDVDAPDHNNGTQVGYVAEQPTGPTGEQPDHITREAPENEQSGKIPVMGNSKENAKALSDTPLFFPGDGEEENKKIGGRTVGGELDTPKIIEIPHQMVTVEKTGDVGKKIPLQIVTINRDDIIKNSPADISAEVINVSKEDKIQNSYGNAEIVTVNSNDIRK